MGNRNPPLTPEEAWNDFWENHRPTIWKDLTATQQDQLYGANRAAKGLLKYGMRIERQSRIFEQYAPGRYVAEATTVYYLAEKQKTTDTLHTGG